MKKLIIITENYPFTRGELPFLQPELEVTARLFDVTIVCKSTADTAQYSLPESVRLLHYKPSFTKKDTVLHAVSCLFHTGFYKELLDRNNPGNGFAAKESDVRNSRLNAVDFWHWMRRNGLFDQPDDTIYYSFWCNESALALAYEKRRRPSMIIVTRAHGYDLFNERCLGGRQPFKKPIDDAVNRIFFVSQMGMDYYLKHFAGQTEAHYVLSYLGVADNGLSPQNTGDCLHLFSCSNLVDIKRVDLLIRALSRITDFKICWTHAGGGPLAEQLAALAKGKLDCRGNITYRFLGAVSNDKVIRFYQENAVDLFITASQTEGGVPVSIMEAFSFGVPAIATRVGGIPEIADDKTGFLLSENPTEEEIADALCAFVQMSPDARNMMKQNARQKWNDNFCAQTNHEKFARMLLQLFDQDMR